MNAAIIAVAVREFLNWAAGKFSAVMLKKSKINQIEASIDQVKKSETEQEFKNSADSLSDLNRIL